MIFGGAHFRNASVGLLLAAAVFCAQAAFARATPDALPEIVAADLPKEGRQVLAQIRKGGPFHYDRDGVVFGNRERLLPAEHKGYYHEYTVRTPGVKSRGARRIICGGPKTTPDACFFTDDHYQSFKRIRE
jgi:ribonuclease T1